MKQFKKTIPLLAIATGFTLTSEAAFSAGPAHYLGLSYISGVRDVWDWHDQNLNRLDLNFGVPVGLSYRFAYQFDSGINLGAGIGPAALILGDIDYSDIPLQLSVGYRFSQSSNFRPYARIGASYHNSSGDYVVEKAGTGLIGALGFEYGDPDRFCFFVEAAVDKAEATFSNSGSDGVSAMPFSREDIAVTDFQLTLGLRF